MSQPRISVIIPAYNCADSIGEMVNSILKQELGSDVEVLLINDGSVDQTGAVCRELAARYPQVVAADQENRGPSSARNRGLEMAQGEYIVFADADDIADADMLVTYRMLAEQNADLGVAGYSLEFLGDKGSEIETICPDTGSYEVNEQFGKVCCEWYANHILTTLCNKLYRRDIIVQNGLRLDEEMSLSEDLLWNVQYLRYGKRVVSVSRNVYFYRIRRNKETLTHKFNPMHIHMQLKAAEAMIRFLERIRYQGREIYYLSLKYITSSLCNMYYTKRWNARSRKNFIELVMREALVKELMQKAEGNGVFSDLLIRLYRRECVSGLKIMLRALYFFRRYFHAWQRKVMKIIRN